MNRKLIRLAVSDASSKSWTEDYEIEKNEDSQAWAESTIQSFNDTLRQGEKVRTLKGCTELGDAPTPPVNDDDEYDPWF